MSLNFFFQVFDESGSLVHWKWSERPDALSELEQWAFVDECTGLPNLRALYRAVDEHIAQADRTKRTFVILFLDIDQFKKINDQYGHEVGSEKLRAVGRSLRAELRAGDEVFRYGGDEFVVLLNSCDEIRGRLIAQRLRAAVSERTGLLVSIGWSMYPKTGLTREALLEASDQAMYRAKRTGADIQ